MPKARHTPQQIADWFLANVDREAGDNITHLKLQKLLFYAQAWSLAAYGEPLFDEDFQAWAHGPVLPSIYRKYRKHGFEPLLSASTPVEFTSKVTKLLESVNETYGKYGAKALERLTHQEAPWRDARGEIPPEATSTAEIPKEKMKAFYAALT